LSVVVVKVTRWLLVHRGPVARLVRRVIEAPVALRVVKDRWVHRVLLVLAVAMVSLALTGLLGHAALWVLLALLALTARLVQLGLRVAQLLKAVEESQDLPVPEDR
jgi:hypothetical protein